MASESSDGTSDDPKLRHHLLRHKLTLDKETTGDKAEPQNEAGQQETERKAKRKQQLCKQMHLKKQAEKKTRSIMHYFIFFQADCENSANSCEDVGMSEELSESEAGEGELLRYIHFR